MANPKIITQASVGASTPWVCDWKAAPFAIGFGCVVNGTVSYTVQHTFDDVLDSAVVPTWFDHATVAAQTSNKDSNYAFPVRAIRLNLLSGTGSVAATFIQGERW